MPAATELSAHRDADGFAPLADEVDGAVGPFRRRAREGFGVDVAGRGVERERDEALAGAVDLDFADVEEGAEDGGPKSDIRSLRNHRGASRRSTSTLLPRVECA